MEGTIWTMRTRSGLHPKTSKIPCPFSTTFSISPFPSLHCKHFAIPYTSHSPFPSAPYTLRVSLSFPCLLDFCCFSLSLWSAPCLRAQRPFFLQQYER